jgi:RAT1-interacting protein
MDRKRTISQVDEEEEVAKEASARAAPKPRVEKVVDQPKKLFLPQKNNQPKPVDFQKPFQLISFSYTPERRLVFDDSALRYWVEPPRNADLSHGYSKWIKRPEERGRLDGLLTALCENKCLDARDRATAVLWRGIMCK